MDISFTKAVGNIFRSEYSETFFFDFKKSNFVLKEFLGGVFIAVAMTGLDQNMMQKNLSCKNLGEAQKNIFWFSIIMVIVNVFFLSLGALLYQFYDFSSISLPMNEAGKVITDKVFPNLALNHLGTAASLVFIMGLTAATFSSADSVLTTLTTSAYYDLLDLDKRSDVSEKQKTKYRTLIHIGFAVLVWLIIILFELMNQQAIISTILMLAGYTYGPLLALFAAGLFSKMNFKDRFVPIACLLGPAICYLVKFVSMNYPESYQIGNELILVNAGITFLCLLLFRKKATA